MSGSEASEYYASRTRKPETIDDRRRSDWPEEFEDVMLDENQTLAQKKRGFFARFVGESSILSQAQGRKRGLSLQQGSELESIDVSDEMVGVPALPEPIRARHA
jgi:hypothetical protein